GVGTWSDNAVSVETTTSTDAAFVVSGDLPGALRGLSGRCNGDRRDRCRREESATGDSLAYPEAGNDRNPKGWRSHLMNIIAWLVLGAIAGYLAGFLVRGDEGLGVIGHIVLGIVGALVGGFLAGLLFNTNPISGPLDLGSIVTATIGAILVVVVVNAVTALASLSDRTTTLPAQPPRGSWFLTADPATCGDRQPGLRTVLIGPRENPPRPTRCDSTARDLREAVLEILAADAMS